MARGRILNIPVYEATSQDGDTYGTTHVGETQARESRHARRERYRQARQSSPKAERRRAVQAEQARWDAVRAAAAAGDPAARLRLDAKLAANSLTEGLRRSGILSADLGPDERRQKFSQWQRAYASTMVFTCLRPLSGGMSANGVMETVGMGTMLWLCSPVFRDQVGSQLQNVHETVTGRISRLGEGKARRKEAKAVEQGLGREDLRRKWQRRLERAEKADRHGLPPFTAESAALMEVGVAEAAYEEMRQPGADAEAVMERHDSALRELYVMAERDGVAPADIAANMRHIVATRLRQEPGLMAVFGDLAHGKFAFDGSREFVDLGTGNHVDSGTFRVRAPMDAKQHVEATTLLLRRTLMEAARESPEALEAQLSFSIIGMQTARYPEAVDAIENPVLRRQLAQSRAIFQAMADDGIRAEEAQAVSASALLGVINEIASNDPEFAAAWHGPEGSRWRHRVSEQVDRFEQFGESVRAHARAQGGGYTGQIWPDSEQPEGTAHVVDDKGRRVDPDSGERAAAPSGEDIVDADIVEDWDAAMRKPFVAPAVPDGAGSRETEQEFVEAMADRFSDDIVASLRRDDGSNPVRNAFLPQSVFSHSKIAFEAADSADADTRHVLLQNEESLERVKVMVSMREELQRAGMPAARQDIVFAAAYVKSLEKVIAREPGYAQVVRAAAGSPAAEGWQEIVFAQTLAQTRMSPSADMPYFEYASDLQGDDLDASAEDGPATGAQMEQARDAFVRDVPPIIRDGSFDAFSKEQATERRRRRQVRNQARGVINREHNVSYENGQPVDLDPGMQFNIID